MSHVPPTATLTNISSKQCIYVCFLQHRLVPYTISTGLRLLRSLRVLLRAKILHMHWKRNSRIKCQFTVLHTMNHVRSCSRTKRKRNSQRTRFPVYNPAEALA